MQTYCLGCKKHTDNICPKKLMMKNKKIKGKSRCADCMADKLLFDEIKHKSGWDIIVPQIFLIYCNMLAYCVTCRKNTEIVNSKIKKKKKIN